jgi:hypothetical protein
MTDNPMTTPPKLEPFKPPFRLLSSHEGAEVVDADGWVISSLLSPHKAEWLRDQLNAARLSQPSAPGVDAEWVLVPREPTLEMRGAAGTAVPDNECMPNLTRIYRAMLSAAPKPTEHSGGDAESSVTFEDCIFVKGTQSATGYNLTPTTPPSGDERAALAKVIVRSICDARWLVGGPGCDMGDLAPVVEIVAAELAKHTSGPHSPAPGLSEEEIKAVHAARDFLAGHPFPYSDERKLWDLLTIISRLTAGGEGWGRSLIR